MIDLVWLEEQLKQARNDELNVMYKAVREARLGCQ